MKKFWQASGSIYDAQIERVLSDMEMFGPESEEYPKLLAHLKALHAMKAEEKPKFRISPDTLAIVGGNLLGILIIVAYEQTHPMVSKGLNYVKPQTPNP